jgi:FAD/FMN-containing dehydrogenase
VSNHWANWSGSLRFRPERIEKPADEEQLCAVVHRAADERRTVRVVGAGHSSSALVETKDVLVSLERMRGLESHDRDRCEAWVRAGTTVHESGQYLGEVGLSLHNTGDVDVQTLVGALGTGTHGSGRRLGNLSSVLIAARVVTAAGEVVELSAEDDPELIRAARVALGSLGVYAAVRVRLVPAFRLRRREWCTRAPTR